MPRHLYSSIATDPGTLPVPAQWAKKRAELLRERIRIIIRSLSLSSKGRPVYGRGQRRCTLIRSLLDLSPSDKLPDEGYLEWLLDHTPCNRWCNSLIVLKRLQEDLEKLGPRPRRRDSNPELRTLTVPHRDVHVSVKTVSDSRGLYLEQIPVEAKLPAPIAPLVIKPPEIPESVKPIEDRIRSQAIRSSIRIAEEDSFFPNLKGKGSLNPSGFQIIEADRPLDHGLTGGSSFYLNTRYDNMSQDIGNVRGLVLPAPGSSNPIKVVIEPSHVGDSTRVMPKSAPPKTGPVVAFVTHFSKWSMVSERDDHAQDSVYTAKCRVSVRALISNEVYLERENVPVFSRTMESLPTHVSMMVQPSEVADLRSSGTQDLWVNSFGGKLSLKNGKFFPLVKGKEPMVVELNRSTCDTCGAPSMNGSCMRCDYF